jgi:hypothetical protein
MRQRRRSTSFVQDKFPHRNRYKFVMRLSSGAANGAFLSRGRFCKWLKQWQKKQA